MDSISVSVVMVARPVTVGETIPMVAVKRLTNSLRDFLKGKSPMKIASSRSQIIYNDDPRLSYVIADSRILSHITLW